jgi:hypothetical protein
MILKMKKLFITFVTLFALAATTFLLTSWGNLAGIMLGGGGAAAGYTDSPGDGKTCTFCHGGPTAMNQAGWIASNVPLGGYVPGTTYTLTATAVRAGHIKFGFQVSPQNVSGALLGTLINTSAQTQLTGGNKYITHTSGGTSGSGSKTWSFDWTAPVAGTGSVTFYGAFNVTNAGGNSSGDTIYTSTLVIAENTGVGMGSITSGGHSISIYPNPVSEQLNIQYTLSVPAHVEISLYDLQGKVCKTLLSAFKAASAHACSFNIAPNQVEKGIYFIGIRIDDTLNLQKIIIE